MAENKKKYKGRVLLVDGNNCLFRGHYATPPLTGSRGQPSNGIKGFFNILIADVQVLKPTHVVVAFDFGGKRNWRKELYPEYKANRTKQKADPVYLDIINQGKPIRKLLKVIGIRTSGIKGEEADDIIGTLATNFSLDGYHVVINSKDKDFAQLVTPDVNMMVSESRQLLDADGILEKFGVYPEQILDYLTLLGDGSDNVQGVFRLGPVTAAKLLTEHISLKRVIKNKNEMTPALLKNFKAVEHLFPLTKKLLTIKTDIPLKTTATSARFPTSIADEEQFNRLCHDLNLIQTKSQILRMLKRKN